MLRFVVVLLTLCLGLGGCGGGTKGTGDTDGTLISGTVQAIDGTALEGATVTVAETGDSGITDGSGNYSLELDGAFTEITLVIAKDAFDASTVVRGLDSSQRSVKVDVVIDLTQGIVKEVRVNSVTTEDPSEDEFFTQAFSGVVRGKNGTPMKGVQIGISGERSTQKTDRRGQFSVSRAASASSVTFAIRYHDLKGIVRLNGLPTRRSSRTELEIVLSVESSQPREGGPDQPKLVLSVKKQETR